MSIAYFTLQGYRALLDTALRSSWEFHAFEEGKRLAGTDRRICLLRHDIDADLEAALKMAQVEAELGVKATYFLMLRSPVYNLMSRHNDRFARQIVALGHHVGLHYDGSFDPGDGRDMNSWINEEAGIVERLLGVTITTVSFHQPGPAVLNQEVKVNGFINTYDRHDMQHFHYMSDSNKGWKGKDLASLFETAEHPKLHVLIHPMWWVHEDGEMSTEKIWELTLLNNWEKTQQQLCETERAYGAKRNYRIDP